ncbi:MAG TPA: hypothetical protein VKU00_30905, partial [Chthonomonadaceae bacterium]|nr:hypothetical protein [Chthonomonadaceae bacterium]
MPEPFDVTLQYLLESDPEAWLVLLGLPGKNVEVIDADLAALPVEPDRVLRVLSEDPFLLHLEFQSGYRQALLERILLYNVLLRSRHGLPTLSYLLLLRPEADGPEMVDVLRCTGPAGAVYWEFQYRILRLWQKPVSELLEGPLATLPFAPLADVAPEQLPDILLRMQARIQAEAQAGVAVELWTIAYILM